MKKNLKVDKGYESNIMQYNKKDGLLVFILFVIFILTYILLAKLYVNFSLIKNNIRLAGFITNLLLVLITILFVKLNNQKLSTIGITKGKWKTSLFIGIILASLFFYMNCFSYLLKGYNLIALNKVLGMIFYYFLVSLCEELVFRGYIGTRLYGLIKNKWIVVSLVGLLFIIIHFPYRMIAGGMTIYDLTINNISWILDLFFTHIIFSIIYMKTNSLYGSILPHWMSNLAYNIVIR